MMPTNTDEVTDCVLCSVDDVSVFVASLLEVGGITAVTDEVTDCILCSVDDVGIITAVTFKVVYSAVGVLVSTVLVLLLVATLTGG